MDFLDPHKKRKHTVRLFLGYILVAFAIALASLILLFQSYGFDVDRKTGQVFQNGLVFVSAKPESASIYINSKLNDAKTDARLPLPAGQYSFELKRDGYRNWKRSFYLEGGDVIHLDYPTLFPTILKPKDAQLYGAAPALMTQSANRRWLLVLQPGSTNVFDVFDTNNIQQPPQTLALPADTLTKSDKPQRLEVGEWSSDDRHVLLTHYYGDSKEFVLADREQAAQSVNLNRTFNINPAELNLRDKSADKFFVYDAASRTLQTADLKSKQLNPYLNHVLTYKTHGSDTVLYSSDDSPTPNLHSIKLWDGGKNYQLRTTANDDVLLDLARYDGHWYVVAAVKNEGRIRIFKDPQDGLKAKPNEPLSIASVLKLDNPAKLSFSANARFVMSQSGNRLAVYDAQEKRRYYYELPVTSQDAPLVKWMDGYRMLYVQAGKLQVFDFDGTNRQMLVSSQDGLPVAFNNDYTQLFNIGPSASVPDKPALSATSLKVAP